MPLRDENPSPIRTGKSRGREREKLVCASCRRHGGGGHPTSPPPSAPSIVGALHVCGTIHEWFNKATRSESQAALAAVLRAPRSRTSHAKRRPGQIQPQSFPETATTASRCQGLPGLGPSRMARCVGRARIELRGAGEWEGGTYTQFTARKGTDRTPRWGAPGWSRFRGWEAAPVAAEDG